MKPDRTVVTFAMLLIASLSLALPAACSSDTGANADGGGGHGGAAGRARAVAAPAARAVAAPAAAAAGRWCHSWPRRRRRQRRGRRFGLGGDRRVRRRCCRARYRHGACAGLHCGQLCNSCPPSAPLCPGAIAYCDANGACVIGSAPVCP